MIKNLKIARNIAMIAVTLVAAVLAIGMAMTTTWGYQGQVIDRRIGSQGTNVEWSAADGYRFMVNGKCWVGAC